jgi:predicted RNase H-like HicB family nuclease
MASVTSTLSVPFQLTLDVHEIQGGGFWGEVRQFPGCVVQADSLEALEDRIRLAVRDYFAAPGLQSQQTARELAGIPGTTSIPDGPYPLPYHYQPPSSRTEADEDE